MSETALHFSAKGEPYGVVMPDRLVRRLLAISRGAGRYETGGILVGYYDPTHTWAVVTQVSGPPADSRSGLTWFDRGVAGLQAWLNRLWKRGRRHHYLGEWHFHPFGICSPSPDDADQIQRIAESIDYNCPEPALLIVGGNPSKSWALGAWVFRRGGPPVPLGLIAR